MPLDRLAEVTEKLAHLSRLVLTNFRNFQDLDLDLPPGVVVLFGANAQGKTTLLEAVYLLAIARSFRAENEREVVNFEAARKGQQALVGGNLEKNGERVAVYVGYSCTPTSAACFFDFCPAFLTGSRIHRRKGHGRRAMPPPGPDLHWSSHSLPYSVRKEIRVNRVRRTAADLVGTVGAVLFNAEDIDLVQGPPAGRRRYLDILISQANPLYLKTLQRYLQVVRQRNRLLRLLREGRAENAELEFWDDRLVTEGSWLSNQRSEAITLLGRFCADHHRDLGSPGEVLALEHLPSVNASPGRDTPEETQVRFREALAARRQRELAAGSTLVGPHRDDFKLLVDGVDMSAFASRGQARTLALTLRLAEATYLSQVRQEEPVVLLDDVLSEMDADRRARVLEKIADYGSPLLPPRTWSRCAASLATKPPTCGWKTEQVARPPCKGLTGAGICNPSFPRRRPPEADRQVGVSFNKRIICLPAPASPSRGNGYF